MNTMAQEMPLFVEPAAEDAATARTLADSTIPGLFERYRKADAHGRLCLWLECRDARRDLDALERACPPEPADGPGLWCWLLGLPRL